MSSPYQIASVLLLLFLVLILTFYKHDKKKKEPLFLLCAFFIISALASFAFYSWEQYSQATGGYILQYQQYLFWLFPFLEELLKAALLIFVLELAQEKFDEINDGIIYGAIVAMGFVFIENTVYATSAPEYMQGSLLFFRSFFSNALHIISTMYFGYFYANGYLNRNKKLFDKKKRSKPYEILRHMKSYVQRYWKKLNILAIPYALIRILTLHITRVHILMKQPTSTKKPHRSGEFILEGFLGAFYIHLLYNFTLQLDYSLAKTLALIIPLLLIVIIFIRFNQIDKLKKL